MSEQPTPEATPLDFAPVVSVHGTPQPSPQEWDCGCVTEVYVTDRDFLRGEDPFEMRLARPCESTACELVEARAALPTTREDEDDN